MLTYIAGIEVGLLGTNQDWCVMDGSILVLHLLILFLVLFLKMIQKMNHRLVCIQTRYTC